MERRRVEESQDEYCRGCILRPGCNVVLKEGESCGDRVVESYNPRKAEEKCPECGSTSIRPLECEEHGRDCPLVICCDCGATVYEMAGE